MGISAFYKTKSRRDYVIKAIFDMVISVSNENKALKICKPDVRKVNTTLFDFFIGQVCEK